LVEDVVAFAVAYTAVWLGIGAYLVRLHRLAEQLADEAAELLRRPPGG